MRRLKVLVAAYACNPLRGSEEAVGWDWVRLIAADHEVTVLTAAYHRADIEAHGAPENVRFVYVPARPWHYAPTPAWRRIEQSVAKPLMNIAYALWQRDAAHLARQLHAEKPFDLAHQLTYVGFRFSGRLWTLGIPFVWGPIGGIENTPWHLLGAMGMGGRLYYGGRNLINAVQRRLLTSPARAARAAGPGAFAATEAVGQLMRRYFRADPSVISEVSVPAAMPAPRFLKRAPNEKLRLVWSGQHLQGKALNLALDALAQVRTDGPGFTLHILGDGPCRAGWQAQAVALGIAENCIWHGHVPRAQALELMANAHAMLITSLKDLTSTVTVEALALGLPVICPDHCGFPDAVGQACGILVPVDNIGALVGGLARAVERLASEEDLRRKMAAAAAERATLYRYEHKLAQCRAVYSAALAHFGAHVS